MDMRQPGDGTSLPNTDKNSSNSSSSSGNNPSNKMCNIFEIASSSKRKRKSVTSDEKNTMDSNHPAKRPNTRQETCAAASQDQSTCSIALDEPQPSGSGTNKYANGSTGANAHQQHQLHHNSNHLHPPPASVAAGPSSTSADLCSATTSDSSVPPSDFDLASPDSIASILSPIGEVIPSPIPVRKRVTVKRKKLVPLHKPKIVKKTHNPEDGYLCCATASADLRLCPLPSLAWANADEVWRLMCRKDDRASLERDPRMLSNHPGIQPRMRAILLDWLIEVCEVYKLHRETFYLAVDYLDRYLSSNIKISKTRLQLIGITCLFVAAKVEEIYPPKIGEFAYVTDGACTEPDIVQQELILLSTLKWSISPVTIIGWLSVYMQLNCTNRTPQSLNSLVNSRSCRSKVSQPAAVVAAIMSESNPKPRVKPGDPECGDFLKINGKISGPSQTLEGDAFVYPQFSSMEFAQTARLIDLCTLDIGLSCFPYSVVAAAAICLTIDKRTMLDVTGLEWAIVAPCVKWMQPFYDVVSKDESTVFLLELNEQVQHSYGLNHVCPEVNTDDSHIIQTHSTSLALFEQAIIRRDEMREPPKVKSRKQEASPAPTTASNAHSCPEGLLTPPASNRKFPDTTRQEPTSEPEVQPPAF